MVIYEKADSYTHEFQFAQWQRLCVKQVSSEVVQGLLCKLRFMDLTQSLVHLFNLSIDNPFTALFIPEGVDQPDSSSNLAQLPFDDIVGTELFPFVSRLTEESQRQLNIFQEVIDRSWFFGMPASVETPQQLQCLRLGFGLKDSGRISTNLLTVLSDV